MRDTTMTTTSTTTTTSGSSTNTPVQINSEEEEELFFKQLRDFHVAHGSTMMILKRPLNKGKYLRLYSIYNSVVGLGGYESLNTSNWNDIGTQLEINGSVKKLYLTYLIDFERTFHQKTDKLDSSASISDLVVESIEPSPGTLGNMLTKNSLLIDLTGSQKRKQTNTLVNTAANTTTTTPLEKSNRPTKKVKEAVYTTYEKDFERAKTLTIFSKKLFQNALESHVLGLKNALSPSSLSTPQPSTQSTTTTTTSGRIIKTKQPLVSRKTKSPPQTPSNSSPQTPPSSGEEIDVITTPPEYRKLYKPATTTTTTTLDNNEKSSKNKSKTIDIISDDDDHVEDLTTKLNGKSVNSNKKQSKTSSKSTTQPDKHIVENHDDSGNIDDDDIPIIIDTRRRNTRRGNAMDDTPEMDESKLTLDSSSSSTTTNEPSQQQKDNTNNNDDNNNNSGIHETKHFRLKEKKKKEIAQYEEKMKMGEINKEKLELERKEKEERGKKEQDKEESKREEKEKATEEIINNNNNNTKEVLDHMIIDEKLKATTPSTTNIQYNNSLTTLSSFPEKYISMFSESFISSNDSKFSDEDYLKMQKRSEELKQLEKIALEYMTKINDERNQLVEILLKKPNK